MFKVAALYLANNLKRYLHEDPSQCGGIDIKTVNSCLDGSVYSKGLGKTYESLFSVYMDWARGCYSPSGINNSQISLAREELDRIIGILDGGEWPSCS